MFIELEPVVEAERWAVEQMAYRKKTKTCRKIKPIYLPMNVRARPLHAFYSILLRFRNIQTHPAPAYKRLDFFYWFMDEFEKE